MKKTNFNLSTFDLDKLPHSEKYEKKVLAFVSNNIDALPLAFRYLKIEGLFYTDWHQKIWNQIIDFSNDGVLINPENLSEHFKAQNESELSVYIKTFSILSEWHQNIASFEKYCLLLNEFLISRVIHRLGYFLNQNALKSEIDKLDLLGQASEGLDKIYQHIASMKEKSTEDAVSNIYKTIVEVSTSENKLLGLPSTLNSLNDRIKGYRKGNLIILAASTGEGKTTLAWQDAVNLAALGIPVGYVSLEMSREELIIIAASDRLKINSSDILEGRINQDEQTKLTNFMDWFKKLPIFIIDEPGLRMGEIKSMSRMWVKNDGVQIIFIDHLHLAYDDVDHNNPEQRYTNIANKSKELAKELNVPVVSLAQLSRREKSDKTRKHVISDLKYAGGIEQAADVILLIYRPFIHGIENDESGNSLKETAFIIVGKLRLMDKKDIECRFLGTSFADKDYYEKPNAGIKQNYQTTPF